MRPDAVQTEGIAPANAAAMALAIVHQTHYDYAAPVSLARHFAHLRPLTDAHQAVSQFALDIDPLPSHAVETRDGRGNSCHFFSVFGPHDALTVRAASHVRLLPRFAALAPAAAPPWAALAERLRYVARAPFDPAVEFVQPSPFVPRFEALRAYARRSFGPGRPVAAGALALMHRLHADFSYDPSSTEVDTPLAQVFAQRRGVCQDFAHLMLGALRMLGLPARYVSGYLLTRLPGDTAPRIGADASHAWIQVYCPGTPGLPADGWLDLDPTNDIVPDLGHVRLAVGRDYGDVTPLRGVIRSGGAHALSVAVRVDVL